jgi:hypothetical protein
MNPFANEGRRSEPEAPLPNVSFRGHEESRHPFSGRYPLGHSGSVTGAEIWGPVHFQNRRRSIPPAEPLIQFRNDRLVLGQSLGEYRSEVIQATISGSEPRPELRLGDLLCASSRAFIRNRSLRRRGSARRNIK